jgi:hypothetical protein
MRRRLVPVACYTWRQLSQQCSGQQSSGSVCQAGGVPGKSFVERYVQVVAVGRTVVVGAQPGEHVAVDARS